MEIFNLAALVDDRRAAREREARFERLRRRKPEPEPTVRPFAQPTRAPRRPYDFHWHGLMGYNDSGIRVVGAHPRHKRLLYNLGCNGVGFLPSIYGGHRLSQHLAGHQMAASVFDPR